MPLHHALLQQLLWEDGSHQPAQDELHGSTLPAEPAALQAVLQHQTQALTLEELLQAALVQAQVDELASSSRSSSSDEDGDAAHSSDSDNGRGLHRQASTDPDVALQLLRRQLQRQLRRQALQERQHRHRAVLEQRRAQQRQLEGKLQWLLHAQATTGRGATAAGWDRSTQLKRHAADELHSGAAALEAALQRAGLLPRRRLRPAAEQAAAGVVSVERHSAESLVAECLAPTSAAPQPPRLLFPAAAFQRQVLQACSAAHAPPSVAQHELHPCRLALALPGPAPGSQAPAQHAAGPSAAVLVRVRDGTQVELPQRGGGAARQQPSEAGAAALAELQAQWAASTT